MVISQYSKPNDIIKKFIELPAHLCDNISGQLDQLQPFWIRRSNTSSLYSLGLSTYLDPLIGNDRLSQNSVRENNVFMAEHFSALYSEILKTLRSHLHEKVFLSNTHPLPGFHIFVYQPFSFEKRLGPHYDQYDHLKANRRTATITIPIRLPESLTGMNVWPINYEQNELVDINELPNAYFYSYYEGYGVIHSGKWLHEVVISSDWQPNDKRITLQGHLVYIESEGWMLYW